jgi:ABC-type antimicrobial peptide transport system permease subunit
VIDAAEVRHVPMSGTGSRPTVWREGDEASKTDVLLNAISDGYLDTLGIRLIAGRDFTPRDAAAAPNVAIVNPSFARQLGIAGNPVGQRFLSGESSPVVYEIVGFIPDTAYADVGEEPNPIVFVPMAQITDPRPFTDLVIRSEAPLSQMSAGLARARADVSSLLTADVRAFDATIDQRLARERLMAALSGFFGVLAMLIAAVGVYGVVAEWVTQRKNEIGVRTALGATRTDIVAMVLRQAAVLLLIGLAAGVVFALAAAGSTRSLVYGLEPRDVAPIALGCVCLAATAAAAILIPACRAAALEPVTALREG